MGAANHITLGVVQFACRDEAADNVAAATRLVREAAARGANIVLGISRLERWRATGPHGASSATGGPNSARR